MRRPSRRRVPRASRAAWARVCAPLLVCLAASAAHAQGPWPQDLHGPPGIHDMADPDGSKRKAFEKDVLRVADGYFVVRARPDFTSVVDDLAAAARRQRTRHTKNEGLDCRIGSFQQLARLDESDYTVTYIYARQGSARMSLTVMDVARRGAVMSRPRYLASEIPGVGAVISGLNVPAPGAPPSAMWYSTWTRGNVSFALYAETRMKGPFEPELSFDAVKALLAGVACTWPGLR